MRARCLAYKVWCTGEEFNFGWTCTEAPTGLPVCPLLSIPIRSWAVNTWYQRHNDGNQLFAEKLSCRCLSGECSPSSANEGICAPTHTHLTQAPHTLTKPPTPSDRLTQSPDVNASNLTDGYWWAHFYNGHFLLLTSLCVNQRKVMHL